MRQLNTPRHKEFLLRITEQMNKVRKGAGWYGNNKEQTCFGRTIYVYDKNGMLVGQYAGQSQCKKEMNLSVLSDTIRIRAKNNTFADGHYFSFHSLFELIDRFPEKQ